MAEISLQRSGIDALVGQRVAASMPEHVRMDFEANLGLIAGAGEQRGEARRGRLRTAFQGLDSGASQLVAVTGQDVSAYCRPPRGAELSASASSHIVGC
jgi:hypothetical protein